VSRACVCVCVSQRVESACVQLQAARASSSVAVAGRSVPKDSMPHSAHAFFLLRTYVSES
jgi:hypothetical protein